MAFTDQDGYLHYNLQVQPLLTLSMSKVVKDLEVHGGGLQNLPVNLKDKLLNILSKRGLLNNYYLVQLLHKGVRVLELIDCYDDSIFDSSLHLIAERCPLLRKLDLNSPSLGNRYAITDQGVSAIASRCRQLQVVYLRRCENVTDESVVALAQNCPGLRDVNIGGCLRVGDAALETLAANCRFLRSLSVSKTQITDQGVFTLCNGPSANMLTELHLNGCLRITDEAIEAIGQMCPNIQLLLFHNCPLVTEKSRETVEEMMGPSGKMKQLTWTIPFT